MCYHFETKFCRKCINCSNCFNNLTNLSQTMRVLQMKPSVSPKSSAQNLQFEKLRHPLYTRMRSRGYKRSKIGPLSTRTMGDKYIN